MSKLSIIEEVGVISGIPQHKVLEQNRVYTTNNTWREKTAEERLLEHNIKPEVANLYIALNEHDK